MVTGSAPPVESKKLAFHRDLLFLANYEEKGIRVGDIVVVLKLHKKGLVTGFLPFLIGWVDFRFASPISFIS